MTDRDEGGPYCDERVSFSSGEYNAGFAVELYIDGGLRSVAALASLNKALDRPFGTVRLAVRLKRCQNTEAEDKYSYHNSSIPVPNWCL